MTKGGVWSSQIPSQPDFLYKFLLFTEVSFTIIIVRFVQSLSLSLSLFLSLSLCVSSRRMWPGDVAGGSGFGAFRPIADVGFR
jgi:hypothetical protein